MSNYIYYINGEFMHAKEAKIPFEDGGFQRGNAVFETIRFKNNNLFYIDSHLQRLQKGLSYLEFKITYTHKELIALMKETINKNQLQSGALNLIVTNNFDINNPLKSKTNLYISIRSIKKLVHQSVKVIFLNEWEYPIIRFKNSIKINSYAGNIKALILAKKSNAFDAVFLNKNKDITEATMRNIFFIKNKILLTPPLSLGILPGTTREIILKLCEEHGYDYNEKIVKFDDINDMDEAFLTSSTYGIISCYWDGWKGNNKITKKIQNTLNQKLEEG